MKNRNEGFTLVEVGVIVPILMILAISLFSIVYSYLLSANREQSRLYQTYAQSTALSRIEKDINLSISFLQTNDSNTPDPTGPSGSSSWNFSGSGASNRVLILREYSTANNPLSTTRTPIYTLAAGKTNCSIATNINGALYYDVIYFLQTSNNTLYRRTLTDRTTSHCGTPYQKLSCPDYASQGAPCAADDEVIATNVTGFGATYYQSQSSRTPLDPYSTPSQLPAASSVLISIQNSQRSYNGTVTSSASIRAVSQN